MSFKIVDNAGQECWTAKECAEFLGVTRDTWTSYASRGQSPAQVGKHNGLSLWRADDVRTWDASRPGPPGARR